VRSARAATLALVACVVVAAAWLVAIVAAPRGLDAPAGSASRLGAAAIYLFGHAVCHQRPERSFPVADHPMPVCARCTGIYLAVPIAGLVALAMPFGASRRRWAWAGSWRGLIAAAIPTVVTVAIEWTTGWTDAGLRAAAGLPLGFAGAALVCLAITQPVAAARAAASDKRC
jgi:uncharacterized membrane protein